MLATQNTQLQQTDIQDGEIFSVGFRPCMYFAKVAIKNGRISELVEVELTKSEYRHIDEIDHTSIIERAKKSAHIFNQ